MGPTGFRRPTLRPIPTWSSSGLHDGWPQAGRRQQPLAERVGEHPHTLPAGEGAGARRADGRRSAGDGGRARCRLGLVGRQGQPGPGRGDGGGGRQTLRAGHDGRVGISRLSALGDGPHAAGPGRDRQRCTDAWVACRTPGDALSAGQQDGGALVQAHSAQGAGHLLRPLRPGPADPGTQAGRPQPRGRRADGRVHQPGGRHPLQPHPPLDARGRAGRLLLV